ncbi:CAP domain-containing protein [bacterium]|nr:CAP domain-containing protein [bacterium]NUN45950.1 CAP domain-containing protein [bacterium]
MIKKLFIFVSLCLTTTIWGQQIQYLHDEFSALPGDSLAEMEVWNQVNVERAKVKLPPLVWDKALRSAARQHSREMMALGYFSHTSPTASLKTVSDRVYRTGASDASLGENIALHSVDGGYRSIADQLMKQWMNSPGHRANILKAEFTHIGIGIASYKDSVIKDTLIRGAKTRLARYTIRHYGTQVFCERDLMMDSLFIEKRSDDFLVLDLQFQSDRSMLVAASPRVQFVNAIGNSVPIHIEIPYEPGMILTLARASNEQTKEYALFFQDTVKSVLSLTQALSPSPVLLQRKDIAIARKEKWFLRGTARLVHPTLATACHVYINKDGYYIARKRGDRIEWSIPIEADADTALYAFAVGKEIQKTITNQIYINTAVLDYPDANPAEKARSVFVKKITP